MLAQTEVDRIVVREKRASEARAAEAEKKASELEARLAELEAERQKAEESKLSATERAARERKAIEDKWAKDLAAANATAQAERQRRHAILVDGRAASRVASIAARLINPDLAPHVERVIASSLRIVDDGKGGERVDLQMGDDPNDTEPLTDESFARFRDSKLVPFFRTEGGAGARHGTGAGNGALNPADLRALPPAERIRQGLTGRR